MLVLCSPLASNVKGWKIHPCDFSLSQGLVVPVIRSVEGMNFADIEKAINALGEKVKKIN